MYLAANNNLFNISANYTGNSSGGADASYRVLYRTLKNACTTNGVTIAAAIPILNFLKDFGGVFTSRIEIQAVVNPTSLQYSSIGSLQNATPAGNALSAANRQYVNDQATTTDPDWRLADEEVALFNFAFNLPYVNGTNGRHGPLQRGRREAHDICHTFCCPQPIHVDVKWPSRASTRSCYEWFTQSTPLSRQLTAAWQPGLDGWCDVHQPTRGVPLAT